MLIMDQWKTWAFSKMKSYTGQSLKKVRAKFCQTDIDISKKVWIQMKKEWTFSSLKGVEIALNASFKNWIIYRDDVDKCQGISNQFFIARNTGNECDTFRWTYSLCNDPRHLEVWHELAKVYRSIHRLNSEKQGPAPRDLDCLKCLK